jgi:hypothetical protein
MAQARLDAAGIEPCIELEALQDAAHIALAEGSPPTPESWAADITAHHSTCLKCRSVADLLSDLEDDDLVPPPFEKDTMREVARVLAVDRLPSTLLRVALLLTALGGLLILVPSTWATAILLAALVAMYAWTGVRRLTRA